MTPTRLDRLIAAVSPARGVRRLRERLAFAALTGAYKGADLTRDALAGWRIARGAPDDLLARDLPALRRRSADLTRNNPLAAGTAHTKVQGTVGTGLKLHSAIDREFLRLADADADDWEATAERLFRTWAESPECHVKRTLNFYEQQDIAFRGVLEAGDHFVQLTHAGRSSLPFRLALQHIPAVRVCNPGRKADTDTLIQGVEKDAAGAPLVYHVCDRHPEALRFGVGTWVSLPAFQADTQRRAVLHLYRALADDQTRGIPDLAAVIEPLKQLDRYTDAEIDAAVKTSLWAMLVKTSTGTGLAGMNIDQWTDTRREYYRDSPIAIKEGTSHVLGLFPDDDIQAFDPQRPNVNYTGFVAGVFEQIGVALELPYEVLTKHFQSSYSAARAALIQAWAFFLGRRVWLAANFCQPVYGAFIDEQVAFGRLRAPGYFADTLIRAAYLGSTWVGDAPGQIDEGKAVEAAASRIALGVSTLKRETAALTGEDHDQVRRQREKELRQSSNLASPAVPPAPAVPASAEELDQADRAERQRG